MRAGLVIQAVAFALLGVSTAFGRLGGLALYTSAGLIALGNGLTTPSLPAFASRRATADDAGRDAGRAAVGRGAGPRARARSSAARCTRRSIPARPIWSARSACSPPALLALARLRPQPASDPLC